MMLEIYPEGLKHLRQIILYKRDLICPGNTYVSDLKFATHPLRSIDNIAPLHNDMYSYLDFCQRDNFYS